MQRYYSATDTDLIVIDLTHPDCCRDVDDDCEQMNTVEHLKCSNYDPSKGLCPYVGK
jgi:hypothetical protein